MVSGCDQKRYPYLCSNKENKMDFEQKLIVVTSRHDCYDNRIYEKQIKSFLKAGYVITYVFPICSGPIPTLFNLTPKKLKSGSIIKKHIEIFNIIRRERIDKLLIHDPDLLIIGLLAKWFLNLRVFFDSHEDVALDIKVNKNYNVVRAQIVSRLMNLFLAFTLKRLTGVITVTDEIGYKFAEMGANIKVVKNYPVIIRKESNKSLRLIVYSGTISKTRGFDRMIDLMQLLPDFNLILAGWISPCISKDELRKLPSNVRYVGQHSARTINQIYSKASFGLCLLDPLPTFKESLPMKILEYTGNGVIPVVSDFKYWREFYPDALGLIYNADLQTTAKKIRDINHEGIDLPIIVSETIRCYSWSKEEEKLLKFLS